MSPVCLFCLMPVTPSQDHPAAVRVTASGTEVAHMDCLPATEPRCAECEAKAPDHMHQGQPA